MTAQEARSISNKRIAEKEETQRAMVRSSIDAAAKRGELHIEIIPPIFNNLKKELEGDGYTVYERQSGPNERVVKISW